MNLRAQILPLRPGRHGTLGHDHGTPSYCLPLHEFEVPHAVLADVPDAARSWLQHEYPDSEGTFLVVALGERGVESAWPLSPTPALA